MTLASTLGPSKRGVLFALLLIASGCSQPTAARPDGRAPPQSLGQQAADAERQPSQPAPDQATQPAPDSVGHAEAPPAANDRNATKSSSGQAAEGQDEITEITFEDINLRMQADVVYRPWMLTDRVKQLDGRRVRIRGYMLPHERSKGIKQFVLLRNKECKFGPGGQADHLVNVTLQPGLTTSFSTKVVNLEGVLKVNPFQGPDGNTWSIYDLDGERVKFERR